jgi:hypothetical protein
MIVFYRSTLLSGDVGDFLSMIQYKPFTFRSSCFLFCLYAVSTLVWNPNVGQSTSEFMIVELLHYLCVLLNTELFVVRYVYNGREDIYIFSLPFCFTL